MKSRIHSIQTLGCLDGPGLRTVVFLQGCGLRCKFCHNVDLVESDGGEMWESVDLANEVLKYQSYWGADGGVTFSGGEPMLHSTFLAEVISYLPESVHVAIDTSLYASQSSILRLLPDVDLWMVSLKSMDPAVHKDLCGFSNERILTNIQILDSLISKNNLDSKVRFRFLILPGVNDDEQNLNATKNFISSIENLESTEVLKYAKHAKFKWMDRFGCYGFDGVREADDGDVERVNGFLLTS